MKYLLMLANVVMLALQVAYGAYAFMPLTIFALACLATIRD
jgi:hypothetical protein